MVLRTNSIYWIQSRHHSIDTYLPCTTLLSRAVVLQLSNHFLQGTSVGRRNLKRLIQMDQFEKKLLSLMYIYSNLIFHFERRRAHFIVPILCISMQVLNNYHLVHFVHQKWFKFRICIFSFCLWEGLLFEFLRRVYYWRGTFYCSQYGIHIRQ